MHRIITAKKRDDELGLAGPGPSSQRPAACEPDFFADVAGAILFDLFRRIAASVDPGQALHFEAWSRAATLRAR